MRGCNDFWRGLCAAIGCLGVSARIVLREGVCDFEVGDWSPFLAVPVEDYLEAGALLARQVDVAALEICLDVVTESVNGGVRVERSDALVPALAAAGIEWTPMRAIWSNSLAGPRRRTVAVDAVRVMAPHRLVEEVMQP